MMLPYRTTLKKLRSLMIADTNQQQFFYRFTNREALRNEKHTWAGIAGLKKSAKCHGMV